MLWDDLCSSPSCGYVSSPDAKVLYAIDATPGAGSLTIEWRDVYRYSDDNAASALNFKVVLHEGLTSQIELSYGTMTRGTGYFGTPTTFDARIGLESHAGADAMWLGPCSGPRPCDFPEIATLTNQKLTLYADAGEDLAVANVSVPSVAYPGLPLAISTRAINRHSAALGPVRFAAYLAPSTATSTAAGVRLAETAPLTLDPFESRAITLEGDVPSDARIGQYKVFVVADDLHELAETDEANNAASSLQSVRIAGRAPDFRVVRVSPLETARGTGETLDVAYTVENAGNEPGRLHVQAYLSSNSAITPTDVPFGAPLVLDSVPRQSFTGTISAVLPAGLESGTYHVGLIVDPALDVPELSETNNSGRSAQSIVVSAGSVAILTDGFPPATLGTAYSAQVRAAGGDGAFSFRLANGSIPRGMSFDVAGAELFGIPLELGTFALEFEVTSGGQSTRRTLELMVIDPTLPLTVVTHALPSAVLGQDYEVPIRVVGGRTPYMWRVVNGSLPPGLAVAGDGTIVGVPSSVGSSVFAVEIRDDGASTATAAYVLDVRTPANLSIRSGELDQAYLGVDYAFALSAVGGVPPIHWRPVDPVPDGLVVGDDGLITGVPEKAGLFHFVVEATDSKGSGDTGLVRLEVGFHGAFAIATQLLPEGQPGVEYRAVVQASGGKPPYTWTLAENEGSLPPELGLLQSIGSQSGINDLVISGRLPEMEANWTFTVRVTDAQGRSDDQPFAIVSKLPPPVVETEESGCSCAVAAAPTPTRPRLLAPVLILAVVIVTRSSRGVRRRL